MTTDFAVATDREVVVLIVTVPAVELGYNVHVFPDSFLMKKKSPASAGGSAAPPADDVVINTAALVILVASAAVDPASVSD